MSSDFKHTLWYDTETFSWLDLRKSGVYRYSEQGEIIIAQWALDDAPVTTVNCEGKHRPAELVEMLEDPSVQIRAHNAQFDRVMTRAAWGLDIPVSRWYCTMAQANAHGLPGQLGKLCTALNVPQDLAKAKLEREVMMLFCKQRPKNHKLRRATSQTHPAEWAQFMAYADQDVVAMREVSRRLPEWNYRTGGTEHRLWQLDQEINDRGFALDLDLADAAITSIARARNTMQEDVVDATDGAVASVQQRDALLKFIVEECGVNLPDMKADTLRRRLEDPALPDGVKYLIELRLENAKNSTAKYIAAKNAASFDGRLRGGLAFCGANRTGRWAGRLFQPHNLPRPPKEYEAEEAFEAAVEAIKGGYPEVWVPDVMGAASAALRGVIVAAPGMKLIPSDWANIEGRGLSQLAGEMWKLRAFREADAGIGPDMYIASYARSFAIEPEDVEKGKRQIGKVQELALGYEGGIGAFLTFAAVYRMDLQELADAVRKVTSAEAWRQAEGFVNWLRDNGHNVPVSDEIATACQVIKQAWRDAHPATVQLWKDLDAAVRNAIMTDGVAFSCGNQGCLKVRRDGAWLRIRLPSGRYLCYLKPSIDSDGSIRFWGVDPYTRQWRKLYTYGGKLTENCTQAFSRDIMGYHMPRLEDAGYNIVLTVHDEPISEVPDTKQFSAGEMCEIMTDEVPWARGLPLLAQGFETYRYRKD